MVCMLDTNVCIYVIKRKPIQVLDKLRTFEPGDVAVSSITVAELQYGACKSRRPDRNRHVVAFDDSAAVHYGEIRAHLERRGNVIGAMDMLIAAHARSLSLTMVTNNIQEFERVPGLRVENWV